MIEKNKNELFGLELLRELSLAFGPSGCEDNVADMIESVCRPYADELTRDKLGNVTAVLYGSAHGTDGERRLMFSAHMDEVGFMITDVKSDGTLSFSALGGIIPSVLPSRRVVVGDEMNKINGVIGSKAIHLQRGDEGEAMPKISELYIDIGAADKEDAEKYVRRGSFGTFRSDFITFGEGNKLIKGKALDDRFGCAVLCDLIRRLSERRRTEGESLLHDIYFAFTVREELGLSGAQTSAYRIAPHRAVILEATATADLGDTPREKRVAVLGDGPAVSFADKKTIYNKEMYEYLLDVAKSRSIKAQPKRAVTGGNDAGHIHLVRAGVKVAAISAPARYIHTACNVIHSDDFSAALELVFAVAQTIAFD